MAISTEAHKQINAKIISKLYQCLQKTKSNNTEYVKTKKLEKAEHDWCSMW